MTFWGGLAGIVLGEDLHAGVEEGVLVVLDEGGADAEAFLFGAAGDEADGGDTVVHQFVGELAGGHAGIADGEVEAVGDGLVEVFVVDYIEAVTAEDLLEFLGSFAVDADLLAEIVFSLVGGLEHGGHRILGAVAGAGTQGVEHTRGEHGTEGQTLITFGEVVEVAMEELVADAGDTDTLTGIAEGLGAGDEKHIVVGIAGDGGLIRGLERCGEVLAEVHGEVSKVFHDDGIVLGGELTDGLQFLLTQTDPRGVVGVRVDDGADVTLLEVAIEFGAELVAAVVVDIEGLVLHAHDLELHLLHGEARVDEEHGVLRLVALRTGEERGEGALHGAADGDTALGGDVDADEGLHKLGGGFLEDGGSLDVGIRMGDAVLKGFDLCVDAYLGGGKSGDAHLHLDELYPTLLLGLGGDLFYFADRGLGKVLNAETSHE